MCLNQQRASSRLILILVNPLSRIALASHGSNADFGEYAFPSRRFHDLIPETSPTVFLRRRLGFNAPLTRCQCANSMSALYRYYYESVKIIWGAVEYRCSARWIVARTDSQHRRYLDTLGPLNNDVPFDNAANPLLRHLLRPYFGGLKFGIRSFVTS